MYSRSTFKSITYVSINTCWPRNVARSKMDKNLCFHVNFNLKGDALLIILREEAQIEREKLLITGTVVIESIPPVKIATSRARRTPFPSASLYSNAKLVRFPPVSSQLLQGTLFTCPSYLFKIQPLADTALRPALQRLRKSYFLRVELLRRAHELVLVLPKCAPALALRRHPIQWILAEIELTTNHVFKNDTVAFTMKRELVIQHDTPT